ncbi:APC family permease [Kibdelosporangium persicum]|uniref:Amino acid permease-associated region n=1 Tax=Kibdelosporangium persicum TaxID=2698649 RepID=A0ABX2F6G6_9PSEU|nr:APC family permease [Kibdelosporangium persicum]NRN66940.1 Amino acid permease-associated region [Kibdelosporangium persicum]
MSESTTAAPPRLRRGLKVLGALLITLSAITPASSVFIIAPGVIGQAGTGAIWSFLAAGVVGVFMAFVYAELASAYPLTGGEYAIVGRTLGRLPGFLVMGLIMVTQVIIIAVIALGVGIYLSAVFPALNGPVVAAVTVVAAAVFGVLDIRVNAWVTGIFLAIEIMALVIVSALGLLNVERPLFAEPVAGSPPAAVTIGVIGAATAVAIFAYNGYGSAVMLGEETTDASRGIARAILWALVITVIAEIVPVTAVLLGAPALDGLFGAGNMMEYFITSRAGSGWNTAISLAIAVAIINAVLAILLLTARLFFSSARDSVWPGRVNRGLGAIHPRFHTPWVATLAVGVLSAAVCFVDLDVLLVVTGSSLIVVYAALCLAVLAGRRNGTTAHARYRMRWFPVPPVLALAALGYVTYQTARDPVIGRPSLLVTLGILVVSAVCYLLRRKHWVLRDPADDQAD